MFGQQAKKYKNQVKDGVYPAITVKEKLRFLNFLNSKSYLGVISDPYSNSECLNKENLNNLNLAFKDVLLKK